jgi:hypothetical protein
VHPCKSNPISGDVHQILGPEAYPGACYIVLDALKIHKKIISPLVFASDYELRNGGKIIHSRQKHNKTCGARQVRLNNIKPKEKSRLVLYILTPQGQSQILFKTSPSQLFKAARVLPECYPSVLSSQYDISRLKSQYLFSALNLQVCLL